LGIRVAAQEQVAWARWRLGPARLPVYDRRRSSRCWTAYPHWATLPARRCP